MYWCIYVMFRLVQEIWRFPDFFNDCDILLSWVEKYPKLFKKPGKRQCNLFSRLKVCFVLDLAWGEGGEGGGQDLGKEWTAF